VSAVNADYLEPKCELALRGTNAPIDVHVLQAADLDGDGNVELIAASKNGVVYGMEYRNCETDWQAKWMINTMGVAQDFKIADTDGDGKSEVVVAVDGGRSNVEVIGSNGVSRWISKQVAAMSYSVDVADINGDGIVEIILGSKNNAVYAVKDKSTEVWRAATDDPVHFVRAEDFDGDGSMEVLALSKKYGSAKLYLISGSGKVLWTYNIEGGVDLASKNTVVVGDFNGDGKMEAVVASNRGLVCVGHDGKKLWSYVTKDELDNVKSATCVRNFVVGGRNIVFVGAQPYIYKLDGKGGYFWKSTVNTTVYDFFVEDLDGDGIEEVIVGARKFIHVFDNDGFLLSTWSYKEEIRGQDYRDDFDIFRDEQVLIGQRLFQVKDASAKSVVAGDFDGDGMMEVAAGFGWEEATLRGNTYHGKLLVFEVNPQDVVSTTTTLPALTTTTLPSASTTLEPSTTTTTYWTTTTTTLAEKAGGCCPIFPLGFILRLLGFS